MTDPGVVDVHPEMIQNIRRRIANLNDEALVAMRNLSGLDSPTGRADSDRAGRAFVDAERSALRALCDAVETDIEAAGSAVDLLSATDLEEAQSLSGRAPDWAGQL